MAVENLAESQLIDKGAGSGTKKLDFQIISRHNFVNNYSEKCLRVYINPQFDQRGQVKHHRQE